MKILKYFKQFYQYIYYRLYLFYKKQWLGNSRIGLINANFTISSSVAALVFSIELILERFVGNEYIIFDNFYTIILLAIIITFLQTIILDKDEKNLQDKYKESNESEQVWNLKGILSVLFVFTPIIILIILMFIETY